LTGLGAPRDDFTGLFPPNMIARTSLRKEL